jgi:hypothetical protein
MKVIDIKKGEKYYHKDLEKNIIITEFIRYDGTGEYVIMFNHGFGVNENMSRIVLKPYEYIDFLQKIEPKLK